MAGSEQANADNVGHAEGGRGTRGRAPHVQVAGLPGLRYEVVAE
jgi:hypothetical protein